MRGVLPLLAVVGVLFAAPSRAQDSDEKPIDMAALERDVLVAFNSARANPAAYTASLAIYRTYFHDKLVTVPGARVDYETVEGVGPLDEAIVYLTAQTSMQQLEATPVLKANLIE